ncbi:MAG: C-GCAxxG-C-C family protein [Proteobacteria bacterium]|nr:C-GCAxxG-C-C family protein [Pseudomonadota bacterium]MBU1139750.1 C-GCAxxG-C-C family protein [Pseudomonadota bacterium]
MGLEKVARTDEEVIKAIGAFGGGIAGSGSVCGTLLGAVAVVSTLYSRGNLEDRENPRVWGLSHNLVSKFEKLTECHGGSNCRDIARLDWHDRDAVKDYYSDPNSRRKYCIELVGDFTLFLGELLENEMRRQNKP